MPGRNRMNAETKRINIQKRKDHLHR